MREAGYRAFLNFFPLNLRQAAILLPHEPIPTILFVQSELNPEEIAVIPEGCLLDSILLLQQYFR
jgi:hypothetical protein